MEKMLFDIAGVLKGFVPPIPMGGFNLRKFPDGETYLRIESEVKNKEAIVLCSLNDPDEKTLSLLLFAETLRSLGAAKVSLITPYLAYMRQDYAFHPGEGISARYFANLLSHYFDALITVDPHLHRITQLKEIFTIPCRVIHASSFISRWIREKVTNPILIGPDEESSQWVSEIAKAVAAPFEVLRKERLGDKEVTISLPDISLYKEHTPVLVDDIISTARTMIETVKQLHKLGMIDPVCIGVHAIFAGDAYKELMKAGVRRIVTCDTIPHESNGIDVLSGILKELK